MSKRKAAPKAAPKKRASKPASKSSRPKRSKRSKRASAPAVSSKRLTQGAYNSLVKKIAAVVRQSFKSHPEATVQDHGGKFTAEALHAAGLDVSDGATARAILFHAGGDEHASDAVTSLAGFAVMAVARDVERVNAARELNGYSGSDRELLAHLRSAHGMTANMFKAWKRAIDEGAESHELLEIFEQMQPRGGVEPAHTRTLQLAFVLGDFVTLERKLSGDAKSPLWRFARRPPEWLVRLQDSMAKHAPKLAPFAVGDEVRWRGLSHFVIEVDSNVGEALLDKSASGPGSAWVHFDHIEAVRSERAPLNRFPARPSQVA